MSSTKKAVKLRLKKQADKLSRQNKKMPTVLNLNLNSSLFFTTKHREQQNLRAALSMAVAVAKNEHQLKQIMALGIGE